MKYFIKKIYLISLFLSILLFNFETNAKDKNLKYSKQNISNYFLGVVSLNQNNTTSGFKYLDRAQSLSNIHSNYNINFIRTLVLLEKFDLAFAFANKLKNEKKLFFEADLLLGIEALINDDYLNSKKYFSKLNNLSQYNLFFEDFLGSVLMSSAEASLKNKKKSFEILDKIPERFKNLKQIQSSFLHCYFETSEVESSFKKLINNKKYSFSRYNFFLANYLILNKNEIAAKRLLENKKNTYNSNLLIKQTKDFIENKKIKKIEKMFNCKNPNDIVAEILYVIANLHSTEENYQLSNFYLKISLFLNNKFLPNKTLLAENFYNQKRYDLSRKTYNSLKKIGSIYSWYASLNSSIILLTTDGEKKAISYLTKNFSSISNPNFGHYYDMANFLKDNDSFKESIKYYSLALKNIEKNNSLTAKILHRRGTSYERIDDWEKAEVDLLNSLKISPDQAHVLNYLAYSWIEKGIKINKALGMLKKATELRKNDGYIIDSLGWAYFKNKNYKLAKKYLQQAVELMPLDPVVNDHYADVLWMSNQNIQARYFWKHVLNLENTKKELKESINKKLVFGISKKL
mgnify:CR=1 FL=1